MNTHDNQIDIPSDIGEQIKLCVADFFVIRDHYEKEKEALRTLKNSMESAKEQILVICKRYNMDKVVSRENNTTFIPKNVEKTSGGTLKDYKELLAKYVDPDKLEAFNRELDSRKTSTNKDVLHIRKIAQKKTGKYKRDFTTG